MKPAAYKAPGLCYSPFKLQHCDDSPAPGPCADGQGCSHGSFATGTFGKIGLPHRRVRKQKTSRKIQHCRNYVCNIGNINTICKKNNGLINPSSINVRTCFEMFQFFFYASIMRFFLSFSVTMNLHCSFKIQVKSS